MYKTRPISKYQCRTNEIEPIFKAVLLSNAIAQNDAYVNGRIFGMCNMYITWDI